MLMSCGACRYLFLCMEILESPHITRKETRISQNLETLIPGPHNTPQTHYNLGVAPRTTTHPSITHHHVTALSFFCTVRIAR